MNKKILLQLILIIIIILLSLTFFFKFIKKDEEDLTKQEILTIEKETNLIKELEYSTIDKQGNSYVITAKSGKIDDKQSDLILMDNVSAKIIFNNDKLIFISADNAIYNGNNFNTNFIGNVIANHEKHTVNSDKLDLLFTINLAVIYDDLIYTNPFTKLSADRMEIDLITKTSKILMNDSEKKILINYND